jgi:hypothetical protein
MLPQRWAVQDEMYVTTFDNVGIGFNDTGLPLRYHFKSDPRSVGAVVLLTADTSTFNGRSRRLNTVGPC